MADAPKIQNRSLAETTRRRVEDRQYEEAPDSIRRGGPPLSWKLPIIGKWFLGDDTPFVLDDIRRSAKTSVEVLRNIEKTAKEDGFTPES